MAVAAIDPVVHTRGSSPWRAAVLIALAWLPAVVAAAALPRFVTVFDRWPWPLPPLTHALMPVARLGVWPVVAAGVGLVAVLVGVYAAWVRFGLPGRKVVALAFAVTALAAFAVFMAAALGPMLTAPPPATW